jgi:hypothetical protein
MTCIYFSQNATPRDAFYQTQASFYSDNDLFIEYDQIKSVDQNIDLEAGTATFVFYYTLKDALTTHDYHVTVKGKHTDSGWVYAYQYTDAEGLYVYDGTYKLTWDILDTETFYKNNETMTIDLVGSILAKGVHEEVFTSSVIVPLSATVHFRGVDYSVTPVVLNGNDFRSLVLKFGSSDKQTVTLSFGEEEYRGGQMCCPIFYGVSADQSHAKVVCDK